MVLVRRPDRQVGMYFSFLADPVAEPVLNVLPPSAFRWDLKLSDAIAH